jgi:hypothetical protein
MTAVSQITDYTSLQNAIGDALDRNDLTTVIPLWIQLLEKDVQKKLRHFKMNSKSTAALALGDNTIALPTDWLETRNIEFYYDTETIDGAERLAWKSPDEIDMRRAADSVAARPCFFTFEGENIEVWPIPDDDGQLAMEYYQKIPDLDTNSTNWLLEEAPGLYLYGSLLHSAPYLRDDPRLAVWDKMYSTELMDLQGSSKRAMTHGSTLSRSAPVVLG